MSKQNGEAAIMLESSGDEGKAAILEAFRDIAESFDQVDCPESCCEAIDRVIGLGEDDILLCDVELLAYAAHALLMENAPREVWLAPGGHWGEDMLPDDISDACSWLIDACDGARKRLDRQHPAFMGFKWTAAAEQFKQVRHINEVAWRQPLDVLEDDVIWQAMATADGSKGALVSIRDRDRKGPNSFMEGNIVLRALSHVVELDDGLLVLGFDSDCESCHMEDQTGGGDYWACDVSPVAIAANEGCLVPSAYRKRAVSAGQTTLGEIASRIGRGTSLTGKSLGRKAELEIEKESIAAKRGRDYTLKDPITDDAASGRGEPVDSQIVALSKDGYAVRRGDRFYIDSGCFGDGKVIPASLESIPKGQERYIVNKGDGEVLLVSRNGKQCAFYKAHCPTLIANSVFIVRLDEGVDVDFLRCWMQSSFARAWLHDEGKMLAKGTLASLPVPILEDKVKELVVKRSKAINRSIVDLRNQIMELEKKERFAPVTALEEHSETAFD